MQTLNFTKYEVEKKVKFLYCVSIVKKLLVLISKGVSHFAQFHTKAI